MLGQLIHARKLVGTCLDCLWRGLENARGLRGCLGVSLGSAHGQAEVAERQAERQAEQEAEGL